MKSTTSKTYLALGDSMSIDFYTGVEGGGAVSQFSRHLGGDWKLIDCTRDGCTIPDVPIDRHGDLITLTIGGNDAIQRLDEITSDGVTALVNDHWILLESIRKANPDACFIVGNIYAPAPSFLPTAIKHLKDLNAGIRENAAACNAILADIHGAFKGKETKYLCLDIEPTHAGATAIAKLFIECYEKFSAPQPK